MLTHAHTHPPPAAVYRKILCCSFFSCIVEKLWPLPDSRTDPFCNGHTLVTSLNISISVLRVTNDPEHPKHLQKAQSKLSRSAKRSVVPRGCSSFTLGPSHMASLIHACCLPGRREATVMLCSWRPRQMPAHSWAGWVGCGPIYLCGFKGRS